MGSYRQSFLIDLIWLSVYQCNVKYVRTLLTVHKVMFNMLFNIIIQYYANLIQFFLACYHDKDFFASPCELINLEFAI